MSETQVKINVSELEEYKRATLECAALRKRVVKLEADKATLLEACDDLDGHSLYPCHTGECSQWGYEHVTVTGHGNAQKECKESCEFRVLSRVLAQVRE